MESGTASPPSDFQVKTSNGWPPVQPPSVSSCHKRSLHHKPEIPSPSSAEEIPAAPAQVPTSNVVRNGIPRRIRNPPYSDFRNARPPVKMNFPSRTSREASPSVARNPSPARAYRVLLDPELLTNTPPSGCSEIRVPPLTYVPAYR